MLSSSSIFLDSDQLEELDLILHVTDDDKLDYEPDEAILDTTNNTNKVHFNNDLLSFRNKFRMAPRCDEEAPKSTWNGMDINIMIINQNLFYLIHHIYYLSYLSHIGRVINPQISSVSIIPCESYEIVCQ